MKKITFFFSVIFLFYGVSSADYLEVRRSATVKENPDRDATIIERAQEGVFLTLLNDGQQQNGYYQVEASSIDDTGWIYRTLVRRYKGNIPTVSSVAIVALTYGPIPAEYYAAAAGLEGEELKAVLHEIIKNHREFSYGSVWDILKKTDVDPQDPKKVIGLYSGFSMDAEAQYDDGRGWNREHVWAKSRGDFGTSKGAGTDVHHVRVEDVSTNSARNNRAFDECDTQYVDISGNYNGKTKSYTCSEWAWEPRDEVKGDVARMMFYMVVRYEGEDNEPDLEFVDEIMDKESIEPVHGRLSTLLEWHDQDPVDDYERYRNNIIYEKYQRNRNPFIDHPEYVAKIWEN